MSCAEYLNCAFQNPFDFNPRISGSCDSLRVGSIILVYVGKWAIFRKIGKNPASDCI